VETVHFTPGSLLSATLEASIFCFQISAASASFCSVYLGTLCLYCQLLLYHWQLTHNSAGVSVSPPHSDSTQKIWQGGSTASSNRKSLFYRISLKKKKKKPRQNKKTISLVPPIIPEWSLNRDGSVTWYKSLPLQCRNLWV
jgi:hypothetical protein